MTVVPIVYKQKAGYKKGFRIKPVSIAYSICYCQGGIIISIAAASIMEPTRVSVSCLDCADMSGQVDL